MDLTVCGSFGFGNAGDEAVPLALGDLAASLAINLRLHAVGRFAEVDMPEVIALGPHDEPRRHALRGQPLMFAGGGMIEPRQQCVLLRCQPLLRELQPKRAVMFAASVEPGVHFPWMIRRRVRRALRRLDDFSVRDVLSAEAIAPLSPRNETPVTGDVVLWMKAADQRPGELSELGRYVAVNLINRWNDDPEFVEWLVDHLKRIARSLEASIVFVPCSVKFDNDGVIHYRAAAALSAADPTLDVRVLDLPLNPRELAAVLRDAALTVGMRLHACIISYAQRTPCVGLVYHPKLIGFGRTAGIEACFLPKSPPECQSEDHHGYRLSDLDLSHADLTGTALHAIETADFARLATMRANLRNAFMTALDLTSRECPAFETPVQEVPA